MNAPAFVSYARKDSEAVLRLAADLKNAGANVWLDQLDIEPGLKWDDAVEQALHKCSEIVAVLSPSSVGSNNVKDEIAFALDKGKTIIPLLIQDCSIPLRLTRMQYVDFRSDYSEALQKLVTKLEDERRKRAIDEKRIEAERIEADRIAAAAARKKAETPIVWPVPPNPPLPIWKRKMTRRLSLTAVIIAVLFFVFRQPNHPVVPQDNQPPPAGAYTPSKLPLDPCQGLFASGNDYDAHVQLCRNAIAGQPDAMLDLGLLYEKGGDGVPQDYKQAKRWWEAAANAGHAGAANDLGSLYDEGGHGVKKDYAQAKDWWEKAANAGNAEAMNNLGILYEKGHGVQKDYAQAKEWWEKAANAGNAEAMDNLGILYEKGHGVQKDHSQAREWYENAATAGNSDAKQRLQKLNGGGQTTAF